MVSFHLNQLQVECTMAFQKNPYTVETIDGLSTRLEQNPEDLCLILEQLVANAIVEIIGKGYNTIYRYIQPAIVEVKEAVLWREI
jgi:hypothetical protein